MTKIHIDSLLDVHKHYYPFGKRVLVDHSTQLAKDMQYFATAALVSLVAGGIFCGMIGAAACVGVMMVGYFVWSLASRYLAVTNGYLPLQSKVLDSNEIKPGQYAPANIRVLNDAPLAHEWKKQLIDSANESIELSVSHGGGDALRDILKHIANNLIDKPNLRAHIVVTDGPTGLLVDEDRKMFHDLHERFPDRFQYVFAQNTFHLSPCCHMEENHVKLLVVDEKYYQVGGTNIHSGLIRETYHPNLEDKVLAPTGEMLSKGSRDLDTVAESEALARGLRRQFFNLFHIYESRQKKESKNRFFAIDEKHRGRCELFHTEEGLTKNVRMKFVCGGSEHGTDNPITREYVKRIEKSTKEIHLANLSFFPVKKIYNALKKKKEGAAVPITYVGNGSNGKLARLAQLVAARGNYDCVTEAYEYGKDDMLSKRHGHDDMLYHLKVGLFHGKNVHTVVGSANLGRKSGEFDHELVVVIKENPEQAIQGVYGSCLDAIQKDIAVSTKKEYSGWWKIPGAFVQNLLDRFY